MDFVDAPAGSAGSAASSSATAGSFGSALPVVGMAFSIGTTIANYFGAKAENEQREDLARQDAQAARENALANAELLRADAYNKRQIAQENAKFLIDDANQIDTLALADYNALLADAAAAQKQGEFQVQTQKIIDRRTIGNQFAAYAAAGVSMSGSALDVLQESKAIADENISNLYSAINANIQHTKTQAELTLGKGRAEAGRYRRQSELALKMGEIEAARIETEADITMKMGVQAAERFQREVEGYGAMAQIQAINTGVRIGESILGGAKQIYNLNNPGNKLP